jgi:hypothetical protein
MARCGEAVVVDGLATRVQRPAGWTNQKVLYDTKRHAHTAQGVAVSTVWGDLLWVDGGWPGSCHEHELIIGMRRSGTGAPSTGSATRSGLVVAPLARAAVPRPGRLPGRRGAGLPRPLAASCPGLRSIMDTRD